MLNREHWLFETVTVIMQIYTPATLTLRTANTFTKILLPIKDFCNLSLKTKRFIKSFP